MISDFMFFALAWINIYKIYTKNSLMRIYSI